MGGPAEPHDTKAAEPPPRRCCVFRSLGLTARALPPLLGRFLGAVHEEKTSTSVAYEHRPFSLCIIICLVNSQTMHDARTPPASTDVLFGYVLRTTRPRDGRNEVYVFVGNTTLCC